MTKLLGMSKKRKPQFNVLFSSLNTRDDFAQAIKSLPLPPKSRKFSINKFLECFATWFLRLEPEAQARTALEFRAAFRKQEDEADEIGSGPSSPAPGPATGKGGRKLPKRKGKDPAGVPNDGPGRVKGLGKK